MKKIAFSFLAAFGCMLALHVFMPSPAQSGGYLFSAIAFNQENGRYGYSYEASTRHEAESIALNKCGYGCSIYTWVQGGCTALATNPRNGYGHATGSTRAEAERDALYQCSQHNQNCKILVWACSG